jgi:hypothetical protein
MPTSLFAERLTVKRTVERRNSAGTGRIEVRMYADRV